MSTYDERLTAWRTLLAAHKAQSAILTTTMATVSANSISAQNITDINAAIVAIAAAVTAANAGVAKPD